MIPELVTVASFTMANEAAMARGFLEANGIEVFLPDEAMSRIDYGAIGGYYLQVRAEDAKTARKLLASVR